MNWSDFGKNALAAINTAGNIVAPAFHVDTGKGSAIAQLEQAEAGAGYTADWAGKGGAFGAPEPVSATPSAPSPSVPAVSTVPRFTQIVTAPDFVIVVHSDGSHDVAQPVQARIAGGRRLPGNGYRAGTGLGAQKFSFGYDSPDAVQVLDKSGKAYALLDARVVLFLAGQEQHTVGDDMETIGAPPYNRCDITAPKKLIVYWQSASGLVSKTFSAPKHVVVTGEITIGGAQPSGAFRFVTRGIVREQEGLEPHTILPFNVIVDGVTIRQPVVIVDVFGAEDYRYSMQMVQAPHMPVRSSAALLGTEALMDNATAKRILGDLTALGAGEFDLWEPDMPTELAPNLYVSGACVLGAIPSIPKNLLSFKKQAPPRAGFVVKTAPKTGRQFTAFKPGKAKTHAQSIANARDAGKRAKAIGQKLLALLKKTPTAKNKARVVGAAKKLGALHPLTAAQLKTLANAAIKAGDDVIKRADKHEKMIKDATSKLQAGVKSVQAKTQPRAGGTGVHGAVLGAFADYSVQDDFVNPDDDFAIVGDEVHLVGSNRLRDLNCEDVGASRLIRLNNLSNQLVGDSPGEDELVGADLRVLDRDYNILDAHGEYGVIGANRLLYLNDYDNGVIGDDGYASFAVPDPNHPGYLTDGTIDPNYAYNAPAGTTVGPPAPADGSAGPLDPSMDPSQNYGLGAPPTTLDDPRVALQPGIDFAPDPGGTAGTDSDHQQAYTTLPNGAIVYDGKARAWNHDDVVSAVAGYGDTGAGVGEGVEPEDPNSDDYSKGLQHRGGFRWHNDGWWFNWGGDLQRPNSAESGSLQTMAQASLNHHWGPLIGNPSGPFKNLRYDAADNVFFWFYDTAPDWAKANILQQQLAKAILDYKAQYTAAAADAAAQAAQDKLAAQQAQALAAQQAQEDAAHQRDMDKQAQAAELAQAQQDQASQAAQAQMDQQQAQFEQSQEQAQEQADLQYQQQQAQMEAAQQAADIQAQQSQFALLQAHPELAPLLLQPQGGGGGDQGAPGGEGELQAAAEPSGEDFSPEDLQALSDFNAPAEAMDQEG